MIEKKSGIYVIERIETGQKYVGKGIDVEYRMNTWHGGCKYLYRALKKYGKDAFYRYIIEYCDEKELNYWENYYIINLHSHVSEGGYNITWGGDGISGFHHSDETKTLISIASKGKVTSEETRARISIKRTGYIMPDESKKKIGEKNKGKKRSNKFCEDMSKRVSGKNHPLYNTHRTPEEKYKMMISHLGKKSPNASSRYFGVHLSNQTNKYGSKYIYWKASLRENGKPKQIGGYKTEIEAARAYDKYVVEHNLPNPLNFPEEYGRQK
jgi:group I intron endonuclease